MAHLARARSPNPTVTAKDLKSLLQSAKEKPSLTTQRILFGDKHHPSSAGKKDTGNRLEHWLKLTNITYGEDVAGNVPDATDTYKVVFLNIANEGGDHRD